MSDEEKSREADGVSEAGLFLVELHITERCNLRCVHCYQDEYALPDPSLEELAAMMLQCREFLEEFEQAGNAGIHSMQARASMALSGGEPLLHEDLFDLLELLCDNSKYFAPRILTNGTLVDNEMARRIAEFDLEVVSVSIDGVEATHDSRRGRGQFAKAVGGIERLVAAGVPTVVSFSADRRNFRQAGEVARIARSLSARRFWSDRCVPFGSAGAEDVLGPEETREYVASLHAAAAELDDASGGFKVLKHRALQAIDPDRPDDETPPNLYRCWAGLFPLAILANGDLYPCRRLPIPVGNLFETHLVDLYHESPLMNALRSRTTPEACVTCRHVGTCRGGLLCLSYGMTGEWNGRDPGCWQPKCHNE